MKTTQTYAAGRLKIALCFTILLGVSLSSFAQEISVYQYRHVPNDQVDEFIKRETTYWSEVAEKATEKGNLTFWALLQKVGGYDIQNSSNFLFVNSYKNVDDAGQIWDAASVFPNVPMADMETYSMGNVTSSIFVQSQGWQQATSANPPEDFKYLKMIYHQASDPGALVQAEIDVWGPFIKTAMDENKTSQRAWGNSILLSPSGPEMGFNTISVDLYPTLHEALDPKWDDSLVVPEGMTTIMDLENGQRSEVIYRIVKVVSAEE
jgi:hypothetical protein